MTEITTYLSILTLNVNGLYSPIERSHLTNSIKKEDPTICCLQELISSTETGWEKIYQESGPPKQAGVAILILR
jgi:exonuclease III